MHVPFLLCATVALGLGHAQPPAAPSDPPPQVRLGQRVERVRQAAQVCPTLVIVPDAASYIEAIARWTPSLRYPVLIDDGTPATRNLIALFARGFEPMRVVRWSRTPGATFRAEDFAKLDARAVTAAVARAWGVPEGDATDDALLSRWKAGGYTPPGVVVVGLDDPAWTAGLALAAGRGQPLVFVKARQGVDTLTGPPEAEALLRAIEIGAESTGLTWRSLGDDLDAVTLCLNTPNRYDAEKDHLAMTDRVGRLGPAATPGDRWAWCGQIFGTAPRAAYAAMGALFLEPGGAWFFDGYEDAAPWNTFDAGKAASYFTRAGVRVEVHDTPRQGAADWRLRAARPLDAGVIFVNTKGYVDYFDLQPGKCTPNDVPFVSTPAAAFIVHSWSAANAGNRDQLAGRWLERGVFAYVGSVHEPFLHAFVPTPVLAARLASGAPLGAAARHDPSTWWKVAVLGDPLYTLGPAVRRAASQPPLDDAEDVQANLRDLLTHAKYAEAFAALNLAGRENETARLAGALLRSTPDAITPVAAREAVLPLFREGETDAVWRVFARLDVADQRDPTLRDALWLSATPLLDGQPDAGLLTLLAANVRAYQPVRDALLVARAVHAARGLAAAEAVLAEIRARLAPADREQLDAGAKQPPETWGR
ncbi:MAG: hypothetical protein HBSAPP03_19250 [Phycisphaerae bacterium]|nr:MAG: hypothetical protein HBSAPP03_19250 [Phycisphaerae bacterium]